MDIKWLGILALLFIAKTIIQKKFPQKAASFQLLLNIAASSLTLVFIVVTAIGTHQVVVSNVNTTDKFLFVLFGLLFVAIFVWANYRFWHEWFRKYKTNK